MLSPLSIKRGITVLTLVLGIGFLTSGISGMQAADVTTTVSSPLRLTTVDAVLGSVLEFLQATIVTVALIFILVSAFFYVTSAGDSGRIETAKKCITYSLFGLALGIAAPAFLKEIYDILSVPVPAGLPAAGTTLSFIAIFGKILDFLLSVVGVVAIIMLVVGAIMYLSAGGDEDRIDTGKKMVKYSIIGIVIALSSLVLVQQLTKFL